MAQNLLVYPIVHFEIVVIVRPRTLQKLDVKPLLLFDELTKLPAYVIAPENFFDDVLNKIRCAACFEIKFFLKRRWDCRKI